MKQLSEIPGKLQRLVWRGLNRLAAPGLNLVRRWWLTPLHRSRNSSKAVRRLEIGPGPQRIEGFETLNVVPGPQVDYVLDASRNLPFENGTFDLIYASHVVEHIAWHAIEDVLKEWVRVLKRGGHLEIWVPDGYKICKTLCDIEEGIQRNEWIDGWRPAKKVDDPYKWVNGRLLYGMRNDYPSWHRAIFTPASLRSLFSALNLSDMEQLEPNQFRSVDHGWINLGMRGRKP